MVKHKYKHNMFQRILTYSVPRSQIVQDLARRIYEDCVNENRCDFDLDYFKSYFDTEYFYDNSDIVLVSDKFDSRMKFRLIIGALAIINTMEYGKNTPKIEFACRIDDDNYYESSGLVKKFYFDFDTTEKFDDGNTILAHSSNPWIDLYNYDVSTDVNIKQARYSQKMTKLNVVFEKNISVPDFEILMNIGYNRNTRPGDNTYSFLKISPVIVGKTSQSLSFLYIRLGQRSQDVPSYIANGQIVDNVGHAMTDITELEC